MLLSPVEANEARRQEGNRSTSHKGQGPRRSQGSRLPSRRSFCHPGTFQSMVCRSAGFEKGVSEGSMDQCSLVVYPFVIRMGKMQLSTPKV